MQDIFRNAGSIIGAVSGIAAIAYTLRKVHQSSINAAKWRGREERRLEEMSADISDVRGKLVEHDGKIDEHDRLIASMQSDLKHAARGIDSLRTDMNDRLDKLFDLVEKIGG